MTGGNFLEMFDLFLFGLHAEPIGEAFFPVPDPVGGCFSVSDLWRGVLMPPAGALILGAYVDNVGRPQGLTVTLAIMAPSTVIIAVTPTYASLQSSRRASALSHRCS